jgi:hypothetical protein
MNEIIEKHYGVCAEQPNGVAEDKERCSKEILSYGSRKLRQCWKRRGHGENGLYCKQHAKMRSKHDPR